MSLENGLILAATGAKGMPLVVEISVAFSILIALIVVGIFLFRIRERFDSVDLGLRRFQGRASMNALLPRYPGQHIYVILFLPAVAAAVWWRCPAIGFRRGSMSPPPS